MSITQNNTQNNLPKNVLIASLENHSNSLPPLISIIIPTYNAESYIARCLESCINQTLHNIEILVIDDCGSDDSIKIAQRYANNDNRIRIIHNEKNLGTFQTRIQGIKHAKGAYIAFLDADDYLHNHTCEKSLQKALESIKPYSYVQTHTCDWVKNATSMDSISANSKNIARSIELTPKLLESMPDIVFFGMRFEPRTFTRISPPVLTKKLAGSEVLYEVFAHCATPPWHICAKLYKASHICATIKLLVAHMGEDVRLTMAEDVLKSFWLCALAHSSVGISDKFYVYYASASSITRKIDATTRDKKIADIQRVIRELESLDSVPELVANTAFFPAQKQAIAVLRSVCELEHRYDGPIHNRGGGGQYLIACIKSLRYHRKWQTFVRIFVCIFSFGHIKL